LWELSFFKGSDLSATTLQKFAFVVLIALMFGITLGWLGGL